MSARRLAAFGVAIAAAFAACDDGTNLAPARVDGAAPDTGVADGASGNDGGNDGCVSDKAQCNSCATGVTDPYNACSSAVTNCVRFDPQRIPQGPNGGTPQVP